MSDIRKRDLNKIAEDVHDLARFARWRAEGRMLDEPDLIAITVSEIKQKLDEWHAAYRVLYPKGGRTGTAAEGTAAEIIPFRKVQ
jgi:hypothetical protein